jgi:hypothetical protein
VNTQGYRSGHDILQDTTLKHFLQGTEGNHKNHQKRKPIDSEYEVTEEWRKMHNEELHNLYSSSIITMIKPRMMRWAGHVE